MTSESQQEAQHGGGEAIKTVSKRDQKYRLLLWNVHCIGVRSASSCAWIALGWRRAIVVHIPCPQALVKEPQLINVYTSSHSSEALQWKSSKFTHWCHHIDYSSSSAAGAWSYESSEQWPKSTDCDTRQSIPPKSNPKTGCSTAKTHHAQTWLSLSLNGMDAVFCKRSKCNTSWGMYRCEHG